MGFHEGGIIVLDIIYLKFNLNFGVHVKLNTEKIAKSWTQSVSFF